MGVVRTKARAQGAIWPLKSGYSEAEAIDAVEAAIKDSIEEERGWIIEIIEKRRQMIQSALKNSTEGSPLARISVIQIGELDHMIFMIRARSES